MISNLNLCVRKTPPDFGRNRLISVLWKHNALQINAFTLLKNLHNPEVTSSNLVLATKPSRFFREGFFNAKPRNKLAWLSGWALKKPNSKRSLLFERLWVRQLFRRWQCTALAIPLNRWYFLYSYKLINFKRVFISIW